MEIIYVLFCSISRSSCRTWFSLCLRFFYGKLNKLLIIYWDLSFEYEYYKERGSTVPSGFMRNKAFIFGWNLWPFLIWDDECGTVAFERILEMEKEREVSSCGWNGFWWVIVGFRAMRASISAYSQGQWRHNLVKPHYPNQGPFPFKLSPSWVMTRPEQYQKHAQTIDFVVFV